jgi:hypothetical protein
VFRHTTLGLLGCLVLQDLPSGHCQVSCEVAGDPADPLTAKRRTILEPVTTALVQLLEAQTGTVQGAPWGPPPICIKLTRTRGRNVELSEVLLIMRLSCTMCVAQTTSVRRENLMTRRHEPKQFPGKVKEKLLTLLAPEQLETLAWQSRFIQRVSSKLTGADFFALMTTDMLDNPAVSFGGLCDLLAQRHPAAAMTPQALQQRMNTPEAVAYLQEVFQLVLREQLTPLYAQVPAALLASFGRVFLEDSTQCCLHEK